MIEEIQAGLCASCLFLGAVLFAVLAGATLIPVVRDMMRRFSRAKRDAQAALIIAASVALAYAAMKPVQNAGADDGITLAGIFTEYDPTNDVTSVEVRFTAGNVSTLTPVSVRNAETENWRELVKSNATVTAGLATNVLAFATAGNVATNRYWWAGIDTPAVIVETAGIEIQAFHATSAYVEIEWTCDDPQAVEFAVQRRHPGDAEWQTVGETSSLYFAYYGFTVGESWQWRVISTYTEGE